MLGISECLEEVFLHDPVESSTGPHNDVRNSAYPNPVLETEGTERFACTRNKITIKYTAAVHT